MRLHEAHAAQGHCSVATKLVRPLPTGPLSRGLDWTGLDWLSLYWLGAFVSNWVFLCNFCSHTELDFS